MEDNKKWEGGGRIKEENSHISGVSQIITYPFSRHLVVGYVKL